MTRRLFGTSINPHLLRDCAASSLANDSVEMAQAAPALLGHRHRSTTEKYYIQADNLAASRTLGTLLENIKRSQLIVKHDCPGLIINRASLILIQPLLVVLRMTSELHAH